MKYLALLILASTTWSLARDLPDEQVVDEYDVSSLDHGEGVARITFSDKYVYLAHGGDEAEPAIRNMPVVAGDFLETHANAYAEIELIDGSLIQFDAHSKIELQAINEVYGNESLSIIKLHKGGLFLHIIDESHDE